MFLNCHTYFSLRYGTLSEEELIDLAIQNKQSCIALTDINNTSACLKFISKAKEKKIKPVVGVDFRNGMRQCYVMLAQNNNGFLNINSFLSKHLHDKTKFPDHSPLISDAIIIYPFEKVLELDKFSFLENEYIGVAFKELNKLRFSSYSSFKNKLVLLQPVTFRHKKDFNTHRLLRAIDTNSLLSKLPKEEQASPDEKILSSEIINQITVEYPHIIENTTSILNSCTIHFDFSKDRKPQNLKTVLGSEELDFIKLNELCQLGLPQRYDKITVQIKQRVEKELTLIKSQNFVSFFLINWKIIEYARSKNYFYVGRGSGANSIVAYLLRITDVDPIELDLYFERFMNEFRSSPPDFDIDFSTWDREDVTSFIFEEFGQNNQAALLGSYVTFKHSGAVGELGKVFGLPKHEIDKLSDGRYSFGQLDDISKLILKYSTYLNDKPNYLSIHAAGILIADKPIHYFSATHLPPKNFPTVQFDMHIAEDVGLYKFDILGQRGLGKIKDAIDIIKKNHPEAQLPDIHNASLFFKDSKINKMISQAECIGCFYVESPAMRMLLKKLKVDNYLTLVAASSIIRPGVAKSGMMREYILRHRNKERRKEAHPVLYEIMPDTYGIMVYQEDVIKVAHHYAKLDLAEADVLRRGMSGKYRSRKEFQDVKDKFKSNCIHNGEKQEIVDEVWRQIESFAGYAFAKGHSASYAVESYQSLYLKCYYPLEYMVATINNGGGFYNTETYIHEARMKGAIIEAPCINQSNIETIIKNKTIYLGLQHLDSLEKKSMIKIINARAFSSFKSFTDFIQRVPLSIEQLDILIRIDALRSLGKDKRSLLWEAYYKENNTPKIENQKQFFNISMQDFKLPRFEITKLENAFDQLELLTYTLETPYLLLERELKNTICSNDLENYLNKIINIYGYLVTVKKAITSRKEYMYFGTFLDQQGNWLDTVHFPDIARKYQFSGKGIYKITGKVVEEFDFFSVEVYKLVRMAYVADPRFDATYNRKDSPQISGRLANEVKRLS
ncbi:DNA polymerase III subunit alpha [Leeuwenhoekiella sp. W20_SRS_FM14]|uniref:DNA polymerase III subunit alpha n=1 Tax=Leeuwenhoekiella sp. W20_SRS_FM14 TaxID=3240270 RepID=UPI003F992FB5